MHAWREMKALPKGTLPDGFWVNFWRIPDNVAVEDIREVILNRTGVDIGLDRILVDRQKHAALVSFHKRQIREILMWALSEDTFCGAPIDCGERPRLA